MNKGRALLAMSGGVDSSTAAYLLRERGYQVIGVFMRTGVRADEAAGGPPRCCSAADAEDARRVAKHLGIRFYILNFESEFSEIMDYFCQEYTRGRTPNPCIRCNQWLKFGKLLKLAKGMGADHVATGHYARVEEQGRRFLLKRGIDKQKDQSYVLSSLTQEQLAHTLFPLGNYTKTEVRKLARKAKLPVHQKPESQEICFIPDNDYGRLVRERFPELVKPGPIRDTFGNYLGEHRGIQFFTIGQRRGLGIAVGEPRYVLSISPADNSITVGKKQDLLKSELIASNLNWIAFPKLEQALKARAKIRYTHPAAACTVEPMGEDKVRVTFDIPQGSITPGQAVVFYDHDLVLGSGWIEGLFSKGF